MYSLIKKDDQATLLDTVEVADTIWKRFRGLMMQEELAEKKGLLLNPSNSIHTFFMKFPIDVIFLDKNNYVLEIIANMMPNRISKIVHKSSRVIESRGNTLSKQLKIGDQVELLRKVEKEEGNDRKT